MIQTITTLRVKDGMAEKFLKTAEPLVKKGQANPGNLFFHLSQSVDDERELIFLENWKDQKAIDEHKSTDEFNTICPKLIEMCARDMEGKTYTTDL